MTIELRFHKRKFNTSLEPIKIMLGKKRGSLSHDEWLGLVNKTKNAIISEPDQYLDTVLPSSETVQMLIDDIFEQFINDQRLRS